MCTIVYNNIDGDWVRLYRALPFHPPRGSRNIENDIEDIAVIARENNEQSAKRSLYRWRRYHTRAKLDDLLKGLEKIRRHDLFCSRLMFLAVHRFNQELQLSNWEVTSALITQ